LKRTFNSLGGSMSKAPSNIYAYCPFCEKETMNHVLRGTFSSRKSGVVDSVVECLECQSVQHVTIRIEKDIEVPVILSKGEMSKKLSVSLSPEEMVSVGEEMMVDGKRAKVTAIDVGEKRVQSSFAKEITTLWTKYYEKVPVKVSIVDKARVYSRKIWAIPEEEFEVGEILELEGTSCVIYMIKAKERKLKKGYEIAENIVRIYTKPIRVRRHF